MVGLSRRCADYDDMSEKGELATDAEMSMVEAKGSSSVALTFRSYLFPDTHFSLNQVARGWRTVAVDVLLDTRVAPWHEYPLFAGPQMYQHLLLGPGLLPGLYTPLLHPLCLLLRELRHLRWTTRC